MVYSNCEILEIGCFVYSDQNLTISFNGAYSDGTKCYSVNNGEITAITDCQ